MGIPGLFKELGKGERVALAQLCISHFEQSTSKSGLPSSSSFSSTTTTTSSSSSSRRPFRLAIDAAIWHFQTHLGSASGGKNPALRTLFYRLARLKALPISPVFVFDGPARPKAKRGRIVTQYRASTLSSALSKRLIEAFRFPVHDAPGEAEAECALLQRAGVVDAVMTEDVDAIMFGSRLTLRDWSAEKSGRKGSHAPTHVSVFEVEKLKRVARGLDPEGMVLVALLSGGDYDPEGVQGIGCTLACEIARAGFGADLLELVRSGDEEGVSEWRDRLQFELQTNESGFFKMKRKNLCIPDTFPDRTVLGYYMNPVVTESRKLEALETKWMHAWGDEEINVPALRDYVADMFDWTYKPGAFKFVRVMAPALLADRLRRQKATDLITSAEQITARRRHFDTGGVPELRVTVVPSDIVGLDLDKEEDSPQYLEQLAAEQGENDDDEKEKAAERVEGDENVPENAPKTRKAPPWLPWSPEKMWVAEAIVMQGAREHVEQWNRKQWEIENYAVKFAAKKCAKKKEEKKKKKDGEPKKSKAKTGGMQVGAMHDYLVAGKKQINGPNGTDEISSGKTTDVTVVAIQEEPGSPPRIEVKARPKTRRAPTTTEKTRSDQTEHGSSPSMTCYFKSTKSHQPAASLQETQQATQISLTKVGEVDREKKTDVFTTSDDTLAENHSRPSTSSLNRQERRNAEMSSKPHPKDTEDLLKSRSIPPPRQRKVGGRSKDKLAETTDEPPSQGDQIQEQNVQPSASLESILGLEGDRQATHALNSEDRLMHVTQRSPKRTARKGNIPVQLQDSPESPPRAARLASTSQTDGSSVPPKRPIESFFKPYLKPKKQGPPVATKVGAFIDEPALLPVPPELTTGLSSPSSLVSHVHAIPRSSLPGTWKEVECESGPSSQITETSVTSRPPRVSIVDLTS